MNPLHTGPSPSSTYSPPPLGSRGGPVLPIEPILTDEGGLGFTQRIQALVARPWTALVRFLDPSLVIRRFKEEGTVSAFEAKIAFIACQPLSLRSSPPCQKELESVLDVFCWDMALMRDRSTRQRGLEIFRNAIPLLEGARLGRLMYRVTHTYAYHVIERFCDGAVDQGVDHVYDMVGLQAVVWYHLKNPGNKAYQDLCSMHGVNKPIDQIESFRMQVRAMRHLNSEVRRQAVYVIESFHHMHTTSLGAS